MSGEYPPLTCKQFKKALKNLGFKPDSSHKATAHEQWKKKDDKGHLLKVTISCHNAPFTNRLLKYMIAQTGYSKKEFYKNL